MKKAVIFILSLLLIFASFNFIFAEEKIEINFFYGDSCPHCAVEKKFLDEIEKKYPQIEVNRYLFSDPDNFPLMLELCQKHDAEKYIGSVPLTFAGEDFFFGFDNSESMGRQIENSIQRQLKELPLSPNKDKNKIILPIVGEIDIRHYSLPALAIILGTLDGFNVCSLGALVLILGLVLVLRSRSKILLFGGIFILTTAVVYGILIVLWYKLFETLSSYLRVMEILIGILGIGGGIYFLRQFIKFKKQGPVCEAETGKGIASKFSLVIKESFKKPGNILSITGLLLSFAAVITIVEFPCSAAVPVVFAGILAESKLSTFSYLLYIAIFLLFYMLDEIIVFLIAVFKMTIWLASGKFVTWITLLEAIFLFLLGSYYLFNPLI